MSSDASGQKYRQKHDPYNAMEESDIRPDFVARKNLSEAESSASKAPESDTKSKHSSKNSTSRLNSLERNQRSDNYSNNSSSFRNNVTGRKAITNSTSKSSKLKLATRFKKRKLAPASIITMLLIGGGALFFLSQSILGPHLSSLYTEATDLQFTSYNARNTRIFKYLINGGDQIKISKFSKKYTTFSPYLQSRLKKNGIEVGRIDADGNFKSGQVISTSKTVLKYNDEIIDANSFQNKFASDANFREAYYRAKRGRIAGFFDDSADYFYKSKGATRDIFDNYKATGNDETDTNNFKETVSDRVTGAEGKINTISKTTDEETGEEKITKNGSDVETKSISGDTPEAKARAMVNSIAGKVSNVGVPLCTVMRIANMTAVTVSSFEIFLSMAYFLGLMEPISKTMAGEGDATNINAVLNFLTGETTNQVQYINEDGSTTTEDVTGSPLQSAGAKLILGNTPSSSRDVAPYSINNITRAATTIAVGTGATDVVCDGALAASAAVSLVSNAVPGGTLAKFVVTAVAQTIGTVALTGIVSLIINTMIPYVAKIFASNIWEIYTGKPAGELFSLGASTANYKLATEGSAYMPASEEYIKKQNSEMKVALAQEAEVDRNNRSPFDASSPNTFLGSLLSKFAFMSYTTNSFSRLSNLSTIISRSMSVFNPTTSAYDGEINFNTQYSKCANLGSTVCNIYDVNIVGMDYSTIDLKPDDKKYVSVIEPNLDSDGNIIEGSELSKFITACTERESPWGVLDVNILNKLQTDFGTFGNSAYVVEDVVDIWNAIEDIANRAWGTGDNCKMSEDNPRWDSEFKYYQRYIEDMRITSSMTDEEDSNPVLAYKKSYAEKHPIDTSFEGTLARISGQSKDDIAFLLEYARYSDKIAKYDPSTRYAFSQNPDPITYNYSSDTISSTDIISVFTDQIFIDRRNYTV